LPNKIRKAKKQSGFSWKNLGVADWTILAIIIVLVLIPDPIDLISFGLPLIEAASALIFVVVRTKNSLNLGFIALAPFIQILFAS
jgi:hypothetical protein